MGLLDRVPLLADFVDSNDQKVGGLSLGSSEELRLGVGLGSGLGFGSGSRLGLGLGLGLESGLGSGLGGFAPVSG